MPSAGSQLQSVAPRTKKHERSTLASTRTSSQRPISADVNPQQLHPNSTLQDLGSFEHVPVVRNSGAIGPDGPVHAGAHASCQSRPSLEQRALRHSSSDMGRESPRGSSYALQLQQARDRRQQRDGGCSVQRSGAETPRLTPRMTPTAAGELSVGAWNSPSIVSAPRSTDDICEQPSLDQFGGTFGTRPDFTVGEQP